MPACRPFWKAMSGRSCLEGHVWKAIWKAIFERPSNDLCLAKIVGIYTSQVLRKQAMFFQISMHLGKTACQNANLDIILMIFVQILTWYFPQPLFCGNLGRSNNMASHLDETEFFVSRRDETTGFDRWCQNLRERVVSGNPRNLRRQRAYGPDLILFKPSPNKECKV